MAAAALVAVVAACAPVEPTGRLMVGAKFPDRQLMVIPEATDHIIVRVTGEKIPAGTVLSTTLARDKTTATFEAVPSGLKTVNAKCYDASEAILATGETTVTITPGLTAIARITLQPLGDEGGFQLILQ